MNIKKEGKFVDEKGNVVKFNEMNEKTLKTLVKFIYLMELKN